LAHSPPTAETGSREPTPRAGRRRRRARGKGQQGKARLPRNPDIQTAEGVAQQRDAQQGPVYGALDLGTNNCRLLIARRTREGFKVVDAYSRIVRLGEGLSARGALGEDAMDRAVEALRICADKMTRRGVTRSRLIATEACRIAANGADFIARVKAETGLALEIVSNEDEARLAVAGCAPLLDHSCASALVFDIGGGSTELIWVSMAEASGEGARPKLRIEDWISLSCGVVTLAERHGGVDVSGSIYESMVGEVSERIAPFIARLREAEAGVDGGFHLLGTSGTVTTIAGVHLGLPRYDRNRVDGTWITPVDVERVTRALLAMTYNDRAAHPCVGRERADLVLAGCAIFEAIARAWPAERLRVADRGLREGILLSLMEADSSRNRRRRRRRRSSRSGSAPQGIVE
jgi:exopolyphosphatase/guanosine-5'-triphosphate,3'-diphosphate pyrophosphatase